MEVPTCGQAPLPKFKGLIGDTGDPGDEINQIALIILVQLRVSFPGSC
jgi:hypothetical protein